MDHQIETALASLTANLNGAERAVIAAHNKPEALAAAADCLTGASDALNELRVHLDLAVARQSDSTSDATSLDQIMADLIDEVMQASSAPLAQNEDYRAIFRALYGRTVELAERKWFGSVDRVEVLKSCLFESLAISASLVVLLMRNRGIDRDSALVIVRGLGMP